MGAELWGRKAVGRCEFRLPSGKLPRHIWQRAKSGSTNLPKSQTQRIISPSGFQESSYSGHVCTYTTSNTSRQFKTYLLVF